MCMEEERERGLAGGCEGLELERGRRCVVVVGNIVHESDHMHG